MVARILTILCLLCLSTSTSMSQGQYAVLFDGVVPHRDHLEFIVFKQDLESLEVVDSVWPGFEIRFNQDGWVGVGVGYHRFQMAAPPRQIIFGWMGDGTATSGYTLRENAKVDQIPVTVYVNIPVHRQVRPFVGIGAGLYRLQITAIRDDFFDNVGDLPESLRESLARSNLKKYDVVAKAMGGVNVFPQKHLILSVAAGYQNGVAFSFGAGVTF
jgi:hypothetical protein